MVTEPLAAGPPLRFGVEPSAELYRLMLERLRRHALRPDVDVEERAALPCAFLEEAALDAQALIEGRAREGRHDRDLDVELAALADEPLDRPEHLRPVTVEAEDEAAIDGDAVGLDSLDGGPVVVETRALPVPALLNAVDSRRVVGLEANQDLPERRISSNNSGSSATAMSVSVNQRSRSGARARRRSLAWRRLTNVLSSANSMKGFGQWRLISWISASTLATGLVLYLGVRRIEAAQNSQRHGQPRWVWTVSRL